MSSGSKVKGACTAEREQPAESPSSSLVKGWIVVLLWEAVVGGVGLLLWVLLLSGIVLLPSVAGNTLLTAEFCVCVRVCVCVCVCVRERERE